MRKIALVAGLCLCLSACTYQEVNEYSVFKYRRSDEWSVTALKTAGNLLPWTGEVVLAGTVGAAYVGFYAGLLYLQGHGR